MNQKKNEIKQKKNEIKKKKNESYEPIMLSIFSFSIEVEKQNPNLPFPLQIPECYQPKNCNTKHALSFQKFNNQEKINNRKNANL